MLLPVQLSLLLLIYRQSRQKATIRHMTGSQSLPHLDLVAPIALVLQSSLASFKPLGLSKHCRHQPPKLASMAASELTAKNTSSSPGEDSHVFVSLTIVLIPHGTGLSCRAGGIATQAWSPSPAIFDVWIVAAGRPRSKKLSQAFQLAIILGLPQELPRGSPGNKSLAYSTQGRG